MTYLSRAFFNLLFVFILLISSTQLRAQEIESMSPEKLFQVIENYSNKSQVQGNVIVFEYQQIQLYCVWDANADRMRLLSPIANRSDISDQMMEAAMQANYHSVLDARYAVGDGVLYSAFIHPLSSITKSELESAIRQVATAAATFGSSYSSGELVFPGNSENQAKGGKSKAL